MATGKGNKGYSGLRGGGQRARQQFAIKCTRRADCADQAMPIHRDACRFFVDWKAAGIRTGFLPFDSSDEHSILGREGDEIWGQIFRVSI
jgi:hypothetical protein